MFGNNNNYLFPPPSLRYHHHPEVFSGLVDHHAYAAGNHQDGDAGDPSAMERMFHGQKKPPPVKKDRHSKIFTSQGPRDRRVRLSIGIARKFFDLQEMLGFDKPSKTLDWLFTKSKAAIKDLVQTKEKTSKHDDDDGNSKGTSSSPLPSDSELGGNEKGKSGNMKSKGSSSNLAKESRAKARARARERTREKMSIKQQVKNGGEANSEENQVNYVDPVGVFQLSEHHQRELAHDSVLIKRKMKIPFFGLQQNAFFQGYGAGSFGSDDQNRDLCAVLDQHRFM